jgi:hypothetical protein
MAPSLASAMRESGQAAGASRRARQDLRLDRHVQRRDRLVGHDHLGLEHQGPREPQPAAGRRRTRAMPVRGVRRESHLVQDLRDPPPLFRAAVIGRGQVWFGLPGTCPGRSGTAARTCRPRAGRPGLAAGPAGPGHSRWTPSTRTASRSSPAPRDPGRPAAPPGDVTPRQLTCPHLRAGAGIPDRPRRPGGLQQLRMAGPLRPASSSAPTRSDAEV